MTLESWQNWEVCYPSWKVSNISEQSKPVFSNSFFFLQAQLFFYKQMNVEVKLTTHKSTEKNCKWNAQFVFFFFFFKWINNQNQLA